MGAANSHISRHLPTRRWRDKKVCELQPAALPAGCVEINSERLISSPITTAAASIESPPAPVPLIPPLPSPSNNEENTNSAVVGCNLPGGIEEPVAMPAVHVPEQRSNLPSAFRGPLEKMDVIKKRPRKLPPLSVPLKKISPLKLIVRRRKLSRLPPVPPINDTFTEPDLILQDIEEDNVKFGVYKNCKKACSGKAVCFELVFPDQLANGTKPDICKRGQKSSKRKLKKQITKKLKAANERKMVS